MNSFFELSANLQAEEIMKLIKQKRGIRKPLLKEIEQVEDSFLELLWKLNEVQNNYNPIPIPPNVPFRFIKRIIGKLIRPYTQKQVHFNQSTTSYLELVLLQFRKMDDTIKALEGQINENIESSKYNMGSLNTRIENSHNNIMREFNERNRSLSEGIEKIHATEEWVRSLDDSHKNLNHWVELINTRVENTESYQERIRKELFAEIKYNTSNVSNQQDLKSKIINKSKYQRMITNNCLKINLGSGTLTTDDYLNVDMREIAGVDVVADARALPILEGSVSELYLSHIIEHFSGQEMQDQILPHWYSIIKPGGMIKIICPNWEAMLNGYAKGEVSYEVLKEVTFGSQEYEGNFHFNMYTPHTLKILLEHIGFINIRVVAESRKNGMCYEMEVEGERSV